MSRVGILGGTFDPVHNGHLRLAEEAEQRLSLDKIYFIPAAVPPHKQGHITTYQKRRHWLEQVIAGHDHWEISDLEQQRGGKSYTYDTLMELRRRASEDVFYFLTGADSLEALTTWHRWQDILELCYFVVTTRPGHPLMMAPEIAAENKKHQKGIIQLEIAALPISSTEIRQLVAEGGALEPLVPSEIIEEVREAWQERQKVLKRY